MKDKITDYFAWFIAKLIKPIYTNREKFKSKTFMYSAVAVVLMVALIFGFNQFVKTSDVANEGFENTTKVSASNGSEPKSELQENSSNQYKPFNIDTSMIDIKSLNAVSVKLYALMINDNESILFKSESEAKQALQALKANYEPEDENIEIIDMYFEEKVEIKPVYKDAWDLAKVKSPASALDFIIKGTDEERKHKIQKGENYWVLADMYGISVNNLIKANPDVVPERLQIGQEVSLIVPEPLINVCTVENIIYDQKIQFDVVYEDNGNLYKDEYRVKNYGVYGKKEIKAELVKRDGKELGKVILDEKVLSEPTTKVVYRGTKNPPPKIGTGVFSKPLNRGIITSGYGNRYHPVYRIYKKHTGVDIAAPYGTPVLASDGGKVIFAGWKSGYGKCVIVDHGANISSLYAHMSSINVKKGEMIYKGKTVGKVGSTGTSTGNHLHFEMRKLGNDINPKNYINLYRYY